MFTLICWYKKGRLTVSKREVYEQKTEELLLPIVESNGFELVDVEETGIFGHILINREEFR